MTLRVHKDLSDCIDDSAVVKDFVACNEILKDSFRGLRLPPDVAPLTIGFAPGPRWGLCPQTPL